MKKVYSIALSLILLTIGSAGFAQVDTTKKKVVVKTITIMNGDTIIVEKEINSDDHTHKKMMKGENMFFHIDISDSMMVEGGERMMDVKVIMDSVMKEMTIEMDAMNNAIFFGDSVTKEIRIKIDTLNKEECKEIFIWKDKGGEHYHFENGKEMKVIPEMHKEIIMMPRMIRNFSVEDVMIDPEVNSIEDFEIRLIPGTNLLMIKAKIDDKKTKYIVTNEEGQELHFESIREISSDFVRILDMEELKSGTYFVLIVNGKSTHKKRIIIR